MRLFVAIDIPGDVRARLRSFVDTLKPLAKLSWSPVENLHITTKFIGEWPEPRLEEMKSALGGVPKTGSFSIEIRNLGWFPDEKRPRVIWAGVNADDSLPALAKYTGDAVAAVGIPHDHRVYSPHLTLARIHETVPLAPVRRALSKAPQSFGSFRVADFYLYLSSAGKYTKLAEFSLE